MNELDRIFFKYRDKNLIMKHTDDDFSGLLYDLEDYFGDPDEANDFLFTDGKIYLKKFHIDLIEPEEFDLKPEEDFNMSIDSIWNNYNNSQPGRTSGEGLPMRSTNEIKRMQELAGIFEEKETKTKEADLNVGLVFDTEELRDKALNTLKKQKLPLVYYSKDAVNIEFPLDKNSKYNKEKLTQVIDKISHQFTKGKLHNSLTEFTNEG
jgi:hypothetical protein